MTAASMLQAQTPEEEPTDSLVIIWAGSYQEALAQGLSENRVILLDFFTDT